jgi:hypothetical protein
LITVRKTTTWVLALGLLLALCVLTIGKPAGAASVEPEFVDGNPKCTGPATPNSPDLGYAHGFKPQPEPPPSGTYAFPGDPDNSVTITSDGTFFDWTSTLGIDAVIVKGGPNANAYVYDPPAESMGDNGLSPPINPNNDKPFAISHIEFCYDYEVKVTKTAQTSLDRTHTWTIEKSADQTELLLQPGQSHDINYTVTLNSTSADSNHAVEGDITIKNPDPNNDATVTDVKDEISGVNDPAAVDCDGSLSFTIPAGGTKTCTYGSPLPDGTNRTNTATVTTSAESKVGGGSGTAPVSFDNATVTEIDESVDVNDSLQGELGTVKASDPLPAEIKYNRPVSFDECGEHFVDNTASFVTVDDNNDTDAEGSDDWSVKVTVPCAQGCTLTMGYWKTHANPNSPRHDATQTLEVLAAAQPPITVGGNTVTATPGTYNVVSLLSFSGSPNLPINKLYAQLVAAKLNIANGADGSAVSTTIANADTFLTGKQPSQNLTNAQKQTSVSYAATLENFNSGGIGPGHCNE